MTAPAHVFRCVWPILDPARPVMDLRDEAARELPDLVARAHGQLTGPGRWTVEDARYVPGCGRTTPNVLVFTAPAVEATRRPYWADLP